MFMCVVRQLIPQISSLSPMTTILPLVTVLAISALKDASDDVVSVVRLSFTGVRPLNVNVNVNRARSTLFGERSAFRFVRIQPTVNCRRRSGKPPEKRLNRDGAGNRNLQQGHTRRS
jgi:hypothetical protein